MLKNFYSPFNQILKRLIIKFYIAFILGQNKLPYINLKCHYHHITEKHNTYHYQPSSLHFYIICFSLALLNLI